MQTSQTLSLIFTIAVVTSIVIQAAMFIGIFVIVRTTLRKLMNVIEELKTKALPVVGGFGTIVEDLTPKIRAVTSQIVEITETVREQTQHVNSTVDQVVDKTKAQANKVDEMVSAVLGSIAHAGGTVQEGIARPVRKAGSVMHGIRIGLDTLFSRTPPIVPRDSISAAHTGSDGVSYITSRPMVPPDDEELTRQSQTIQPPPTTSSPR